MRDIKFRLRIGKKIVGYEKWYQGSYGEIMTANACWLYSKDGEAWLPSYIFHKEKDQFTGLKDNKGVEIYEGDIMDRFPIYKGQITKRVVKWNKQNACFDGCFGEKVIGNIFENPALMESK